MKKWDEFFTESQSYDWIDKRLPIPKFKINNIFGLKKYLDTIHIRQCLLRPFFQTKNYPLVEARELLPSFESDLFEYENLPGFSLVAFARPIEYFNEIFQFDIIHNCWEEIIRHEGESCPLFDATHQNNLAVFQSRLPKILQDDFKENFSQKDLSELTNYPLILDYILNMDRGHVLGMNARSDFYLAGVYASFPSDLDPELKRFGLRIKKFKPNDNLTYELNRTFVYQFLMELYGYPVVSERRTSAALFARRLFKIGEHFLIRALGQTDRTITTLYSTGEQKFYPALEKLALVRVETKKKDTLKFLRENNFYVDERKKAVILRVKYRQHRYDPNNVREERALSIHRQEVIHPLTGEVCTALNIISDTSYMTLKLNDIVKGEYSGRIKYKREIIENTDTHEKRLKFLFAWLGKHQRRIIGYSDEFYAGVTRVLDNYLLEPNNYDHFNDLYRLYQEVWNKYSYIRQARKIRILQDLMDKRYAGKKINYLSMLEHTNEILTDLKFELVNYFDEIVARTIYLAEKISNDRYLIKNYIKEKQEEDLTDYGLEVRKHYGRMVSLLDELKSIRKVKLERHFSS
ncbi:hypothetical protein [Desulfonatronovibrio hydrogenovorans]|uniref:hypothetical protein n=1 Tax=Desulfonatronovibrio hydrogenovorans TaxID=53245 RepID=UPI00054E3C94|nr:hypothetical protein [Desulfonatronovibrio hydrogenovorans]